jgi:thiamine biosynthesis lipoprotein
MLAVLLALAVELRAAAARVHVEEFAQTMGTTFAVEIYGGDRNRAKDCAVRALDEARRLDRLLSNYIPGSEISKVNAGAAVSPVPVSRETFKLLRACIRYSQKSEGTFDITVGSLMKVWGFYRGSGRLPSPAEIEAAEKDVGYRNLQLDQARLTVRFHRPGLNLDPGGVGKGYAVDRMVRVLRRLGVTSALVSAGGSSIYGIGAPPDDPRGWLVSIQDPRDEHATVADVYLKNKSLSTSGSYEKFFWAEGKLYSHIMDPRTGRPAAGIISVSVIAPHTLDSEVWAKPYYILGRAWTLRHKPKRFTVLMCEDATSAGCSWVGARPAS